MRIYRFEHVEPVRGKMQGPYATAAEGAYCAHDGEGLRTNDRHPSPSEDGIAIGHRVDRTEFYFGFAHKADALEWFASEKGRQAMAECGCLPWEFKCHAAYVVRGNRHLAFKRAKATRVRQLDPATLKPIGE